MTLADDVDLEVFIMAKDELSGADIKAICTESGLLALRERRMKVCLFVFFHLLDVLAIFLNGDGIPSSPFPPGVWCSIRSLFLPSYFLWFCFVVSFALLRLGACGSGIWCRVNGSAFLFVSLWAG